MKAIFLLLILICPLLLGVSLLLESPYRFYETVRKEGLSDGLVNISKPNPRLFGTQFLKTFDAMKLDSESLWKMIDYDNYSIPLPFGHPSFYIAPRPFLEGNRIIPAFSYSESDGDELVRFRPLQIEKVDLSLPPDKLFRLPLVRKYIHRKKAINIWHDIYNKNLKVEETSVLNPFKSYELWSKVSPIEIAYNIYLYKMREKLILNDALKIYFIGTRHILSEVGAIDEQRSRYIGQYFHSGRLYTYELLVKNNFAMANMIMTRFIRDFKVSESNAKEDSQRLYAAYRAIPYNQRASYDALNYLYSAWTHEKENQAFIREIIQFFEKNKDFQNILTPMYSFARKKWGTTFSNKDKLLDEAAEVRLQRGIEQEKRKEEMELGNFETEDIENLSKEEKIKYLLKKGKRYKQNNSGSIIEN
ncbi:hypothetical protein [Bacteriovorax sp. Seq25_V]|uniref:hypothetical protein n=1 Tax=Bacteriovorax sp. Seq25_V TaxID=1201288 RepID=UPI0012F8990F|nr:hypothetical protein [Bacteriovorax sp. Seq25_V]